MTDAPNLLSVLDGEIADERERLLGSVERLDAMRALRDEVQRHPDATTYESLLEAVDGDELQTATIRGLARRIMSEES